MEAEDGGADRGDHEPPGAGLPEYEPDEVMFEDNPNTRYVEVLDAYGRVLRCGDLAWQHHSEFLLLGYGTYATLAEFCKNNLPDIPDQHIAQMVAGIDVLLFMPDAELRRLARLAVDTGLSSAFVEGRSPDEIDAELAQSDAGRAWLDELERVKDPWFNMPTGDGLYRCYGSWLDDPGIPYASLVGYVRAFGRTSGRRWQRPSHDADPYRTADPRRRLRGRRDDPGIRGAARWGEVAARPVLKLVQCACDKHPRQVRAVLAAGAHVARRLGSVGRMRRGVGDRSAVN